MSVTQRCADGESYGFEDIVDEPGILRLPDLRTALIKHRLAAWSEWNPPTTEGGRPRWGPYSEPDVGTVLELFVGSVRFVLSSEGSTSDRRRCVSRVCPKMCWTTLWRE